MKKWDIWLLLQLVLTVVSLCLVTWSFFDSSLLLFVEISFLFTMLLMAYNNYRVYKRRSFTYLYGGVGMILLIVIFYHLWGGK